jgi:hypothetical protein
MLNFQHKNQGEIREKKRVFTLGNGCGTLVRLTPGAIQISNAGANAMKKWLAVFLMVLAVPLGTHATTMLPMYLDDLTAASQTVVYGTVTSARTEWDEGHQMIFTIYTVVPSEYLKGQLGPTFELREPGGERDGMETIIAGVPAFRPGQEALLFVWTDPQGRHQATAFEQGAVKIETDVATGAKRASRAILLGSARGNLEVATSLPAINQLLPQLLDQVRASVAKTHTPASGE